MTAIEYEEKIRDLTEEFCQNTGLFPKTVHLFMVTPVSGRPCLSSLKIEYEAKTTYFLIKA